MNESELLLTEILNCDRASLYLNKKSYLGKNKSGLISNILKKRISGQPLQYILGKTEFMGLEIKVNEDVLIPRPETEILVDTAIKLVRKFYSSQVRKLRILDLGTGSGSIAISLAKFFPEAIIDASDISEKALIIAKENAKLNKVNINFIQSDLFSSSKLKPATYNLIVSNPPYVSTGDIEKLQPEIGYEPAIALDGGTDGLDFYRRIICAAQHYLDAGGYLLMEMGFKQNKPIEKLFKNSIGLEIAEVVKDYSNIDRVIVARKRD